MAVFLIVRPDQGKIKNLCVLCAFAVQCFAVNHLPKTPLEHSDTMDIEKTGKAIVHSAIKVHKTLGPGLLESVYQKCLAYELSTAGHGVECEIPIPVQYGKVDIDMGFRADMIVDKQVIIENKTVESIAPIHEAQILTYLKATELQLGYLLNWNVVLMKKGIRRMVNNL